MNFNTIKTAVAAQFARIQQHPLFRADVTKDELWSTYLGSFPPNTNPILRERTEHDCSCCRQFIRTVGDVVAIIDGEVVSIWDAQVPNEPAYEAVTAALSALVKSRRIISPFLHYEAVAGTDRNFEQLTDPDKTIKTWTHFFINIPPRSVKSKADIPSHLSECVSAHDVFLRSIQEITTDAIDTVLDLIAQNSLYRGEEHRAAVVQFQQVKRLFDELADARAQDNFAWTATDSSSRVSGAVLRIRNTVIGTLLVDLSEGKDLESAVASFESKVAPINYKRPTALVTKAMIEKAKQKLAELGLTSALDRRYATARDISVNDILFADRTTRRVISGDVFDELAEAASSRRVAGSKSLDKVEEIPIDRFVSDILPRVDSVEIMFENKHQANLVSLIAPCDPTAKPLFKWNNLFSWSYTGELADAIKERVKQAGGNITGDLCCRLAWFNHDDLDFHMSEPNNAYEIYFGNKHYVSPSGGKLDVDMNVTPTTREPVENIFYSSRQLMKEGTYHLFVHQYNARETQDTGFECEVDYLGQVHRFVYAKALRTNERVTVAKFRYSHKDGLTIIDSLPSSQATRVIWSLPTQTFHRVSVLMMSPNYWDGVDESKPVGIGNKHYLFILDGCRNDGSARGFFNEFLRESLTPHRKVFEVVGSRMKPADSDDQLSGLGFSSTRRDTVICRVKGSFTRTVKIMF